MLKDIRESRGLSQRDLAEASNIPLRQIQAFEQGYRDINGANLSTLLALATTMRCPLWEIVTDDNLIRQICEYERASYD